MAMAITNDDIAYIDTVIAENIKALDSELESAEEGSYEHGGIAAQLGEAKRLQRRLLGTFES